MLSESTFLIQIISKPLPFPKWRSKFHPENETGPANIFVTDNAIQIIQSLNKISKDRPEIKTIIIDDYQYLMANEYMKRASETGFTKFTQIASNAWSVINACNSLRPDLNVVFFSHSEEGENGKIKCKTIGKMLDQTITLEGLFTMVLQTVVKDGQYYFLTKNNGNNTVKSPMGLFQDVLIENDLNMVLSELNEYEQGESPIEDEKEKPKRSEWNKHLTACKTKEEYEGVKVAKFVNEFGDYLWDTLTGNPSNKTETWKQLFSTHMKRVSKSTKPQDRWDERILKCDTIEGWHKLNEEYLNSVNLQSPENEQLLNDSKSLIGITEDDNV
jgi:hypothetical protein